jgi:membrane-associated phospholipid phosphatase
MTKNELRKILISRLKSWLMFNDYGAKARRSMVLAWASIGCFALVDIIWLPASPLSFASSNWKPFLKIGFGSAAIFALLLIVSHRLRDKSDRVGCFLRELANRTELLCRTIFILAALSITALTFSYLATSTASPLQDAWLAEIDHYLGFDWTGLLRFANSDPTLSWMLVKAYHSTGHVLIGVVVWLSLLGRAERLAEFIAILCLTLLGVEIGMFLIPAAGAYTHYSPPQELFSNFSAKAGMWHYELLTALRTDATPVIDFAKAEGMITFPSFHTVLGIITAYALRDTRWVMIPVLLLNGTMIVATLPEGGHYLLDLIAGGAIAIIAIMTVRLSCIRQTIAPAIRRNPLTKSNDGIAGGRSLHASDTERKAA